MKSKYDKNDSIKKTETQSKSMIDLKNDDANVTSELKCNSFWTKSTINQNGFCPKSVRNHLKKTEKVKQKELSCTNVIKGNTDPLLKNDSSPDSAKSPITKLDNNQVVSTSKINNDVIDLHIIDAKQTDTKLSLICSSEDSLFVENKTNDDVKHVPKNKKKKKHSKSKVQDVSDNECKDTIKKTKKSHKSKKKRNKSSDKINSEKVIYKENNIDDNTNELKSDELHKSFLVSYSSDEDDNNINSVLLKNTSEIKLESVNNSIPSTSKSESKIEIKLKPTKSPGKSTWESSESEIESDYKKGLKEINMIKTKSPKLTVHSPQLKKSKSLTKSVKSITKSPSKCGSMSQSESQNSTSCSSRSSSYSEYSHRSSRSYSRSRSHSKTKRHSRRRKHYSSSSSSYSRSRSRYHSRSSSRSTSYSRSSRSYTRSRSRYKSSYSSKYRSRSRSHSSRSRSNSYYRSSYRKRKRSSSTDRFLNVPTRKVKAAPIRNSALQGSLPRHIDIGKKIDAIKESQRKAVEAQSNENVSNLNIPLPPDKPKGNVFKSSESYTSIEFNGPAAKKSKKNLSGTKTIIDLKSKEKLDNNQLQYMQSIDYSNYIGPQVSSDMAKKLGLEVKSNINTIKKEKKEPITSDSFVAPTLDAAHMALQSRAYQHRLYNLQGSTNQDITAQSAQYYHPMYMTASSLSNNLTAIASAAVANEQLPASVAGSLAQAAVQRIMSSSNLTATYNTPSVMTSPSAASLQTALQHGIPQQCGTVMANTPSGLIPISLLQQGGYQVGINPLIIQQMQQQAFNAHFGQAMSLPNQHLLSGVNQLLLQASNQQALLQSLGVNAQAQLLGSPLNIQHALLLAAQQQQQQLIAAAQINQATLQAAHLQAQIQAQARAVSFQNLQQAAQMQSSAQNAATHVMTISTDSGESSIQKLEIGEQLTGTETTNFENTYIYSDHGVSFNDNQNPPVLQDENTLISTSNDTNTANEIVLDRVQPVSNYDNNDNYNSAVIQQAARIVYNGPTVMDSIDILSSNSKS